MGKRMEVSVNSFVSSSFIALELMEPFRSLNVLSTK